MGFCDRDGVEKIKAFGNDEELLWCEDHATLAKANLEAEEMFGPSEN